MLLIVAPCSALGADLPSLMEPLRLVRYRSGIVLGLVLAIAWAMAGVADAQRSGPLRIGALTESWGPTTLIVGLRNGLQELGYHEERDFTIGVRFTQGDPSELPAAARDLVRLGVDLIVAGDTISAAKAARLATDRIPIVFVGGSDPVEAGLVKSFARPGGNVTGIADIDLALVGKRLELFRDVVPGLQRVLLVYDAANVLGPDLVRAHRDAAHRLGLTLVERPVRTQDEAQAVIGAVRKGTVDGIVSPRLHSLNIPGFIMEAAARAAIPTMFHSHFYVERGALASYGADRLEMGRQAARLVDKILRGARPADLPVEQANRFELSLNRKTARALGLAIPEAVLLRVDRIIDDGPR